MDTPDYVSRVSKILIERGIAGGKGIIYETAHKIELFLKLVKPIEGYRDLDLCITYIKKQSSELTKVLGIYLTSATEPRKEIIKQQAQPLDPHIVVDELNNKLKLEGILKDEPLDAHNTIRYVSPNSSDGPTILCD